MSLLLRIAAVIALGRAAILFFLQPMVLGDLVQQPETSALAHALGVASLGFALLFWRGASNPDRERSAVYTALLVIGLRGAIGVVELLYRLTGDAAVFALVDMIASIALFVGMVNALPAAFGAQDPADD